MSRGVESEDDCSRRVVREETRGKDGRARRGKVGHLRDEPPNTHRTICGVNADSERTRTVRSGEWLGLGDLQCINCRRSLERPPRMKQAPLPIEESPAPVHWVRSHPEGKSAEERGLNCGAPYSGATRASSYRDQVTCAPCLAAADGA